MDIRGIGATCVAALVVCMPLMASGAGVDSVPAETPPVILQVCNTWIAKAAPLFALGLAGLHGGSPRDAPTSSGVWSAAQHVRK